MKTIEFLRAHAYERTLNLLFTLGEYDATEDRTGLYERIVSDPSAVLNEMNGLHAKYGLSSYSSFNESAYYSMRDCRSALSALVQEVK